MSRRQLLAAAPAAAVLAVLPSTVQPHGPPGLWHLQFSDGFNGDRLDPRKWTNTWFGGAEMNGVATVASNVKVGGGLCTLRLSDPTHGALIHTTQAPGRWSLPVGGCVEARIRFPGNGRQLSNWFTFWANDTNGDGAGGENDIIENAGGAFAGDPAVNYHSPAYPAGTGNQGSPPGYWGDAFHTYTLVRHAHSCDVYWGGMHVKHYPTADNGAPEDIILSIGVRKAPTVTGAAGAMQVDWVRGFVPA